MIAFAQDERWDDVRLFLAAFRHRTLGVAAGKLGLDTSTMSRRLTAFETSLGRKLFQRSRDGLTPTHAGEQLLPAAEAMEAAHARLTRDSSAVEAEAAGVVRVSVAPGMADAFIAPALARFRSKHPRITIELDASTRPIDLTRREAEIAVRSVAPKGADLLVTKLGTGQWLAAGSRSLVKKLGTLRAWTDAPWIHWDHDLAAFPAQRWLAEHTADAEVPLRTSLFSSQLDAAANGHGLVLVPSPYAKHFKLTPVQLAPRLREAAQRWPVDSLWLVGHQALRDVPRVAAVWKFLNDELRQSMGDR
ncbi:MAG: LysR family transcriptional regulator [Archangium sp.]